MRLLARCHGIALGLEPGHVTDLVGFDWLNECKVEGVEMGVESTLICFNWGFLEGCLRVQGNSTKTLPASKNPQSIL